MATKLELEEAIRDIWQTAQDADGSRGGMQEALDIIQDSCGEVLPELEDVGTDGDGIPDSVELDANDEDAIENPFDEDEEY